MMAETLHEKTTRLAHVIAYGSHERQKRIIGEIIGDERARACRIINEYSNNTPDLAVAQMANDLVKAIAMGDDAAPASAASDEDNIIAWCGTNGAEWRRKDNRSPVHMTKPRRSLYVKEEA